MKVAFISDIHGNIEALTAVLNDIKKQNIDKIYCLGDLVGYGPNPNEVIELIKNNKIQSIMGNYDDAIGNEKDNCGCSYNPGKETQVGDISINWTIKNTTEDNKNFLKNLPHKLSIKLEEVSILLVHGSPLNSLLEYIKPDTDVKRLNTIIEKVKENIVINGHTHLSMIRNVNGKTIFNAGSVGRTKEGEAKAIYLVLNIESNVYHHEFRKVDYNVKKTCEKIIEKGLPIELALFLALGSPYDMGKIEKKINFKL
jgi:putative phosphoesterase